MTPGSKQTRLLSELRKSSALRASAGFQPGLPLHIAWAPGRLDVMGGIADYSGSWVFEQTIAEGTLAAVQLRDDDRVIIASGQRRAEFPMARVVPSPFKGEGRERMRLAAYRRIRKVFDHPRSHWASYVAGCLSILAVEKGWRFQRGFSILIHSSVPEGKGVSSSAALETASMRALVSALGKKLAARELPLLCQKVENLVAGAPCGIMDQISSAFGKEDTLLPILCRPHRIGDAVRIPKGICFAGLDSGKGHRVAGADYGTVRAAAFMGLAMLRLPGLRHLAELDPTEFETRYATRLPSSMSGREFLRRYKNHGDPVTRVEPARMYPVLAATRHPVWENHRVVLFMKALKTYGRSPSEDLLKQMGDWMYQSHASYSSCGLGAKATDRLVEKGRELGPGHGIYGAKITGGGSGGTVALLIKGSPARALRALDSRGRSIRFLGSSPGAHSIRVLKTVDF